MTNSAIARLNNSGYSKTNSTKTDAYWALRNAGFTNIEAENFIAQRLHWFSK